MGLLDALKSYVSDAAGGSLNPEIGNTLGGLLNYGKDKARYIGGLLDDNAPINQDLQNWHKKTQLGLADLISGKEGANADYGYEQLTKMSGLAPIGMTAWHGSPHKFDKFSLDKIGTGEGAQAYGHGLYLAESPEVAASYQKQLSGFAADGKRLPSDVGMVVSNYGGDVGAAVADKQAQLDKWLATGADKKHFIVKGLQDDIKKLSALQGKSLETTGALYKTDIPDEAVARFLDWDKSLAEQPQQVQAWAKSQLGDRLEQAAAKAKAMGVEYDPSSVTGQNLYTMAAGRNADASSVLRQQGIPGIRYLDGGSRSAGQGSSNFVAFDPEMIRILERNGQPTGQQPWALGEWLKAQN